MTLLRRNHWCFLLLLLLCNKALGRQQGYVVGSLGGLWQTSSFRASSFEDTPNFQSYGVEFSAGYALLDVGELRAMMSYRPINYGAASFDHADSQQIVSGLELGVNALDGVYMGLRYALSQVSLQFDSEAEISGKWQGAIWGFCLAGRWNVSHRRVWQIGVVFETGELQKILSDPAMKKVQDAYILSLSYLFYSKF